LGRGFSLVEGGRHPHELDEGDHDAQQAENEGQNGPRPQPSIEPETEGDEEPHGGGKRRAQTEIGAGFTKDPREIARLRVSLGNSGPLLAPDERLGLMETDPAKHPSLLAEGDYQSPEPATTL
jgi:hypothetical protein